MTDLFTRKELFTIFPRIIVSQKGNKIVVCRAYRSGPMRRMSKELPSRKKHIKIILRIPFTLQEKMNIYAIFIFKMTCGSHQGREANVFNSNEVFSPCDAKRTYSPIFTTKRSTSGEKKTSNVSRSSIFEANL